MKNITGHYFFVLTEWRANFIDPHVIINELLLMSYVTKLQV